jgi:hypothetical protein
MGVAGKHCYDFESNVAQVVLESQHPMVLDVWHNKNGVKKSDVILSISGGIDSAVEVKTNITDNLVNPRMGYQNGVGGGWHFVVKNNDKNVGSFATSLMENDDRCNKFLDKLQKFTKRSQIKLSSRKSDQNSCSFVGIEEMRKFYSDGNMTDQYIYKSKVNASEVLQDWCVEGKRCDYIQIADNFFRLTKSDPLDLVDVPVLDCTGTFHVRVSLRTKFYEIQPEVKLHKKEFIESPYSLQPNTDKTNPLVTQQSESLM